MSEILDNMVVSGPLDDVLKCRTSEEDSAPCGGSGKLDQDIEQAERKKKTRRRKAKRKNPYTKQGTENKKNMRLRDKMSYRQPVAPYNSNQFLIEDHNDLQDFDVKLMEVHANRVNGEQKDGILAPRAPRTRDASFTSAESDEDFFYSSPEDEEEFLSKEFSNTYRDLHVESLASMSKPELIQTILQLEEKVDSLQKRLDSEGEHTSRGSKSPDQTAQFQTEISKLVLANQRLVSENARLREGGGRMSSSSEDSESDSSSTSDSSEDEEMPPHGVVNDIPIVVPRMMNGETSPPKQDNT